MLIWAPLQIVNCLMAIFKFFSRGLSSVIFNTTYNKDGSINYQFSLTSQLGYIILFVFIVALMMFFINFLLSFSQLNNTVDSKGLPQTAPVRKFVYLR
jgi:hypothetical protein